MAIEPRVQLSKSETLLTRGRIIIRERAALQLTSFRSVPNLYLALCCQLGQPSMFKQCGGRTRDQARAADGCPRSACLLHVASREGNRCCAKINRDMHRQHAKTKYGTYLVPEQMQAAIPDGQESIIRPPLRMRAAWLL
eukprot:3271401-Amphidinium_carterae.2